MTPASIPMLVCHLSLMLADLMYSVAMFA